MRIGNDAHLRRYWHAYALAVLVSVAGVAFLAEALSREPIDPEKATVQIQGFRDAGVLDARSQRPGAVSAQPTNPDVESEQGDPDLDEKAMDDYFRSLGRFEHRADDARYEFTEVLREMDGPRSLAFLDETLATQGKSEDPNVIAGVRLRRLLAVRFHAYVYFLHPELGPELLSRLHRLLVEESDVHIVAETLAVLGGLRTRPFVLNIAGQTSEGFDLASKLDGVGKPWEGSIAVLTASDEGVRATMFSLFNSRYRRSAIPALANLQSPEVDSELWQRGKTEPVVRELAGPPLVARIGPNHRSVLKEWLSTERRDKTLRALASSMMDSPNPIPLTAADVLDLVPSIAADPEGMPSGRGSLMKLLGKVWKDSRDVEAKKHLLGSLSSSDSSISDLAVTTIVRLGDVGLLHDLNAAQESATLAPYALENIRYAIKKLDPASSVSSLQFELDELFERTRSLSLSEDETAHLEASREQKYAELRALRQK